MIENSSASCYHGSMTWDYHKKAYKKQAKADPAWHLERLINYGLNGEKIDKTLLKKHLPNLHIPPQRKTFLQILLNDSPRSHSKPKKRH